MLRDNQQELDHLLEMFREAENTGPCVSDFYNKCSDGQIQELERNITSLNMEISAQGDLKAVIKAGM
jgi:cytochrome c553